MESYLLHFHLGWLLGLKNMLLWSTTFSYLILESSWQYLFIRETKLKKALFVLLMLIGCELYDTEIVAINDIVIDVMNPNSNYQLWKKLWNQKDRVGNLQTLVLHSHIVCHQKDVRLKNEWQKHNQIIKIVSIRLTMGCTTIKIIRLDSVQPPLHEFPILPSMSHWRMWIQKFKEVLSCSLIQWEEWNTYQMHVSWCPVQPSTHRPPASGDLLSPRSIPVGEIIQMKHSVNWV